MPETAQPQRAKEKAKASERKEARISRLGDISRIAQKDFQKDTARMEAKVGRIVRSAKNVASQVTRQPIAGVTKLALVAKRGDTFGKVVFLT